MRIDRLLMGVLAVLVLPAHAQTTLERLASPSVRQVVDAIIEISPVTLPPEMWQPYSVCLIDAMDDDLAGSEDQAALLLVRYITTFDRPGTTIDGHTASRINNEVVVPCLSLNPIYVIDEGLVSASITP